jgi:hypothetical protein
MVLLMAENTVLTKEQITRLKEWVANHWKGDGNCPVCHSNNWEVGSHLIVSPIISPSGGMRFGGPVYPYAFITCTVCAYTLHFNAVMIGLMPPSKIMAKEREDQKEENQKKESENGSP